MTPVAVRFGNFELSEERARAPARRASRWPSSPRCSTSSPTWSATATGSCRRPSCSTRSGATGSCPSPRSPAASSRPGGPSTTPAGTSGPSGPCTAAATASCSTSSGTPADATATRTTRPGRLPRGAGARLLRVADDLAAGRGTALRLEGGSRCGAHRPAAPAGRRGPEPGLVVGMSAPSITEREPVRLRGRRPRRDDPAPAGAARRPARPASATRSPSWSSPSGRPPASAGWWRPGSC